MINIWVIYKPTLKDSIRSHVSPQMNFKNIHYFCIDEKPPLEVPQLILSVGGDGTFLTGARYAHKHKCPIIGFHAGTLGFLAQWNVNDKFFIENAINTWLTYYTDPSTEPAFTTSYRHLVHCQIADMSWNALNEFTISPSDADRIIRYDQYIGHGDAHDYAGQHTANGVIIASATGSTAYSLSVNGALMDPEASTMLQIAPIAPLSMTSRPLIIGDDAHIHVIAQASHERPIRLRMDGQEVITLTKNTKIRFMSHHRPLEILQPLNTNWYHSLTEKLHWNTNTNNRIIPEDNIL